MSLSARDLCPRVHGLDILVLDLFGLVQPVKFSMLELLLIITWVAKSLWNRRWQIMYLAVLCPSFIWRSGVWLLSSQVCFLCKSSLLFGILLVILNSISFLHQPHLNHINCIISPKSNFHSTCTLAHIAQIVYINRCRNNVLAPCCFFDVSLWHSFW